VFVYRSVLLVCRQTPVSKLFLVHPLQSLSHLRWTYGANRVQVDADMKILSEFLSYLQTDSVRELQAISSLSPVQVSSRNTR
jgi:hypothetical protein